MGAAVVWTVVHRRELERKEPRTRKKMLTRQRKDNDGGDMWVRATLCVSKLRSRGRYDGDARRRAYSSTAATMPATPRAARLAAPSDAAPELLLPGMTGGIGDGVVGGLVAAEVVDGRTVTPVPVPVGNWAVEFP